VKAERTLGGAQQHRTSQELSGAALRLTGEEAKKLDATVRARPENLDNLEVLARYYELRKNTKALEALTLWYIAEHPDVRKDWGTRPFWDQVWNEDTYAQGRDLWNRQLKKTWDSPWFYMNAAEFLSGHDNEQAEQVLLEGQRRMPPRGKYSGLHWEVFLARHYAWVLEGGSGQLPAARIVTGPGSSLPETLYAQKVRAMLTASNDPELLFRVAEQLQASPPDRKFAIELSNRVLRLSSFHPGSHRLNLVLREQARLTEIQSSGVRTDSERLALLLAALPTRHSSVRAEVLEAQGRQLLKLASRNTKDPNYGTAIFAANMIIGEAELDRGNTREAVRRLLAASQAPSTEFLRYSQLDMLLASRLLGAGERDAVAAFLNRCAKLNYAGWGYAMWAGEIRRGGNPRMGPFNAVYRPI
jgi:hypothetical protein